MHAIYDLKAPKKPTNLSVNSDLLSKAKKLKINLSATFEEALDELVRKRQAQDWISSNQEAMDTYNEYVEKNDTFSRNIRSF